MFFKCGGIGKTSAANIDKTDCLIRPKPEKCLAKWLQLVSQVWFPV